MTEAKVAVAQNESAARKEAAGISKRGTRYYADPDALAIDPQWNVRYEMGDIEELAQSILSELKRDPESGGLLHEIGVRRISPSDPLAEGGKKHFAVRWGHRRTMAIRHLRKKGVEFPVGVPIKIADKAQDIQHATIQMFVENNAKPLLPLEEAIAYKRLKEGFPDADPPIPGMTIKEICTAVGRAAPHVTEMLALLEADEEVKEAVKNGEISKMDAKHIAKVAKGDKATQKQLTTTAKKAKKGDKKARAELQRKLHEQRATKAAGRGKTIKMRALSDQELNDLGLYMQKHLQKCLKQAGKAEDTTIEEIRKWVEKDDKFALAASFGAMMALRCAAGVKTDLNF